MNCRQARSQLHLYLDGQLLPRQRWALEVHLSRCPGCRQAWLDLRQATLALEGLSRASAPTSLLPRVMALVAERRAAPPSAITHWLGLASWAMGLLGTLAGLALLALGHLFDLEMGLGQSALAQEPELTFDSLSISLGTGLEGLVTMVDDLLLGIPDLEASLLLGGCLLLLSTGGLILRALGQPQSASGGLALKGGI